MPLLESAQTDWSNLLIYRHSLSKLPKKIDCFMQMATLANEYVYFRTYNKLLLYIGH